MKQLPKEEGWDWVEKQKKKDAECRKKCADFFSKALEKIPKDALTAIIYDWYFSSNNKNKIVKWHDKRKKGNLVYKKYKVEMPLAIVEANEIPGSMCFN